MTVDEFAHIAAGVSQWERGTFSLYRENPPLIRCVSTLPVWLSGVRTNYSRERIGPGERTEWEVGQDFSYANAEKYRDVVSNCRSMVMLMGLACGALIYHWSSTLHGKTAAAVGAGLWFLDPNVVAHSGLATLDVGATAVGFAATYLFWKYLGRPSWPAAILSGIALGFAQASKFSLLTLYPAWLAMVLVRGKILHDSIPINRLWRSAAAQFGMIVVLSIAVLNACYLFEGTGARLGDLPFISSRLRARPGASTTRVEARNRFDGSAIAGLRLPLPAPYLLGIDSQKSEEERGLVNLVDGELDRRGDLASPLRTLFYKLPLGTLALLGGALIHAFVRRGPRDQAGILLIPPVLMLGFLCTQTGLNWAVRYSLIALPFLFLAAGSFVREAWSRRSGKVFIAGCLAFNASEAVHFRGHSLAYANQFAGGYENGHRYFLGSNYDWGQDLIRLKRWTDDHPAARPVVVCCYGAIDPRLIGLGVTSFREGPPSGRDASTSQFRPYFLAVSANLVHGLPLKLPGTDGRPIFGRLSSVRPWSELEPAARVGRTLFIFHITSPEYEVFIDSRGCAGNDGGTS